MEDPSFLNNSGLLSLSGMAPFYPTSTTHGPLLSLPNHFPAFKITFQLFPLLIFPSSVLSNTVFSSPLTSQLFPNPLALSSFLLSSLISLDPDAHHFIHTLTNTLHSLPLPRAGKTPSWICPTIYSAVNPKQSEYYWKKSYTRRD